MIVDLSAPISPPVCRSAVSEPMPRINKNLPIGPVDYMTIQIRYNTYIPLRTVHHFHLYDIQTFKHSNIVNSMFEY
ncbi:hypothetical protein ACN38_g10191 [Penicillium nordicum]|uniref:Uncharacterized protein n=1 Tax=Penicillium nordicum TaxID=229535 RepID=A0A0M9WBW3_9EURO|nr:hypothetical protein ACN38_g10191 [Penicillium nordicum]